MGMAFSSSTQRYNQNTTIGQEIEDWSKSKDVSLTEICNSPSSITEIFWLQKVLFPEHFRFPHWTNTSHQRTKYYNKFQDFLA